jgi:hypothetical protein
VRRKDIYVSGNLSFYLERWSLWMKFHFIFLEGKGVSISRLSLFSIRLRSGSFLVSFRDCFGSLRSYLSVYLSILLQLP